MKFNIKCSLSVKTPLSNQQLEVVQQLFDSIKKKKAVNKKQIESEFRRLTGRQLAFTTLQAAYETYFDGKYWHFDLAVDINLLLMINLIK